VLGYYSIMGGGQHMQCVARSEAEYIELASRLSSGSYTSSDHITAEADGVFRKGVRASIAANEHRLYEDPQAISEWASFISAAARASDVPEAGAQVADSAFE
jgi:hypothetical protein